MVILAGLALQALAEKEMAAVDAGDLDGAERILDEHTSLRLLHETLGWS